jgi:bifunctional non-homologous end joining protein LigD
MAITETTRERLAFSNLDKVFYPATGFTKGDLVDYYRHIAPVMLPHLAERPVTLKRYPDGVDGLFFFEKRCPAKRPPWVRSLRATSERFGSIEFCVVDSADALLWMVNRAAIEFHTYLYRRRAEQRPTMMVFDLDPGAPATLLDCLDIGILIRDVLADLGLQCLAKTSGGKGLHLVVPLKKQFDWDTVKDFSAAVVQHMARTLPDRFVAKSGASNRIGRIFIDYLRNGYGATTACAWSARARPGLGISVPVRWDELQGLKGGAHWTVSTVHTRLDQGNAPWADYEKSRCTLGAAMKKLGFEKKR